MKNKDIGRAAAFTLILGRDFPFLKEEDKITEHASVAVAIFDNFKSITETPKKGETHLPFVELATRYIKEHAGLIEDAFDNGKVWFEVKTDKPKDKTWERFTHQYPYTMDDLHGSRNIRSDFRFSERQMIDRARELRDNLNRDNRQLSRGANNLSMIEQQMVRNRIRSGTAELREINQRLAERSEQVRAHQQQMVDDLSRQTWHRHPTMHFETTPLRMGSIEFIGDTGGGTSEPSDNAPTEAGNNAEEGAIQRLSRWLRS